MPKAVRYHKQGGPEVLQLDEIQVGDPGPGQARVRHKAIGVNFVDTYQRSGLYPMQLPAVAGRVTPTTATRGNIVTTANTACTAVAVIGGVRRRRATIE